MPDFFDCLHCGVITPIAQSPPKCALCGHGTGVIVSMASDKPSSAGGRHEQGGDRATTPERAIDMPPVGHKLSTG